MNKAQRTIAYTEKDLNEVKKNIQYNCNQIIDFAAMLIQQLEGRRDNIDKEYVESRLIEYLEMIRVNMEYLSLPIVLNNLEERVKHYDEYIKNQDLY